MGYRSYNAEKFFSPSYGFRGAVKYLIIINCIIFVFQQFTTFEFIRIFGLVPSKVINDLWIWQIVSYMFLHGGFVHLLFNMFCLWMFGRNIEAQWGSAEFIKFYFITGIGAALFTIATSYNSTIPSIGASGSVYGLLVAFAMMYPNAVIYLYFLFPVKAKYLIIIFAAVEFLASFSHNTGIANFAHLGGMLTGFLYLRYGWKIRNQYKSILEDIFNINTIKRKSKSRKKSFTSDDLTSKVNRILEKILVNGADSLTKEEKKIMDQYSELINKSGSSHNTLH
ncbi:MAG: rhomboid family intramembrane serine protease [bacterium]